MPTVIPEKFQDLLEKKIFVSLATLMPDGRPQVTPVWFDFDGQHVVINSAKGRVKDRNMRRDARVALLFIDPENPYRHLQVPGRVVEITESGADQHIDKLAKKYLDKDKYPFRQPGEVRVIYKIEITDAPARRVIVLRGVAQLMAQINLVGELGADGRRLFLNCPIIPGQGHYRIAVWPISQSLSFLLYCLVVPSRRSIHDSRNGPNRCRCAASRYHRDPHHAP